MSCFFLFNDIHGFAWKSHHSRIWTVTGHSLWICIQIYYITANHNLLSWHKENPGNPLALFIPSDIAFKLKIPCFTKSHELVFMSNPELWFISCPWIREGILIDHLQISGTLQATDLPSLICPKTIHGWLLPLKKNPCKFPHTIMDSRFSEKPCDGQPLRQLKEGLQNISLCCLDSLTQKAFYDSQVRFVFMRPL